MKWVRLAPLFMFALALDGFQFFISTALSVLVIPSVAGGAVGAGLGAYICNALGASSEIIAGCSAAGGTVVGLLGTFFEEFGLVTVPIGIGLGFAISVCISLTLGSMLILFLKLAGVLDGKAALVAYMGEALPGLSILPAWTALVVRCALKGVESKKVRDRILRGASSVAGDLVLPYTAVGDAMRGGTLRWSGGLATEMSEREATQLNQPEERRERIPMQDMRVRPVTSAAQNNSGRQVVGETPPLSPTLKEVAPPSLDTTYAKTT
jgi:hypothetical protein